MKKAQTTINKPIYLGLSILDLNKTVMFEFWYDSVKPKYGEKSKIGFYGYRQLHCRGKDKR